MNDRRVPKLSCGMHLAKVKPFGGPGRGHRNRGKRMVHAMRLSRRYIVTPFVAVALVAVGAMPNAASAQQPVTVPLGAGRDANEAPGTATLTDLGGGRTRVDISVTSSNANMPAHLHADVCPGVAAVVFPLTNVANGQSTTEVNASLADIMARSKSINLHKSPDQIQVYVSCGNLPATAGGAAPAPGAAPAAAPAAPAQRPGAAPAPAPAPALPRTGEGEFGLYGLAALGALLGAAGAGLARRRS